MTNRDPKKQFSSTWPDKLRKLKVNETLFISADELSIPQVRHLASNLNARLKGDAIYKSTHDTKSGDSIVVCVFRKKGATLTKHKPYGIKNAEARAAAAASNPLVTQHKRKRESLEVAMPKPMEAFAIIECTYVNGGAQSMRAADSNELDVILERCRHNEQVTEIITYKRATQLRKQVQWQTTE